MKFSPKLSTPRELRKMTPEQIDTELFPLWAQFAMWSQRARKIRMDLKDTSPRSMYRSEINRQEAEKTLERYEAEADKVGTFEVDSINGSMRLYMPRGKCRKCNHMTSVTSIGRLRKHKKEV